MNTKQAVLMPRGQSTPQSSPRVLHALCVELDRWLENESTVRNWYPWADRFVMGLPLLPWQRGFVWSMEQSQRFITSAWTGIHLGQYMLTEDRMCQGSAILYEPLANAVIDGQQRLRALELYLTDQLPVPDADGRLAIWSDLPQTEQSRFRRTLFPCGVAKEKDEAELRKYYDLLNFGGSPHKESERASVATAAGGRPSA